MIDEEQDYFFWLGEDGTAEELSKDEFDGKQDLLRANLEDWLNVRINTKAKPNVLN